MYVANLIQCSYLAQGWWYTLPCYALLKYSVRLTMMWNSGIKANVSCHRVAVDRFLTCASQRLQKISLSIYLSGIDTGLHDHRCIVYLYHCLLVCLKIISIDCTTKHHSAPASSEVGSLPAMYSFSGPTSLPEFDLGHPCTSEHLQRATLSNKYVAEHLSAVHWQPYLCSLDLACSVVCIDTSVALSHSSWETRCLRKNRKRLDDE